MASIRRTSPAGIADLLSLSTNLKVLLIEEGSSIDEAEWNASATLGDFTSYTTAVTPQTAGSATLTQTGTQVILDHATVTFASLAANVPDIEHVLYAVDVGGGDAESLWKPLAIVDAASQPDGGDYNVDPGAGIVIWETKAA